MALLHVFWVAAVIVGPVWGWRNPFWRGVHLGLLFVTALAWSFYCPLTTIENVFRSRFEPSVGYQTGFLEHYLRPLLHLEDYRSALAWAVRGWAVLWTILYGVLWAREVRPED